MSLSEMKIVTENKNGIFFCAYPSTVCVSGFNEVEIRSNPCTMQWCL